MYIVHYKLQRQRRAYAIVQMVHVLAYATMPGVASYSSPAFDVMAAVAHWHYPLCNNISGNGVVYIR